MTLDELPAGTVFLDVEGVPVALLPDNNEALAFDTDPPRNFKAGVAAHNGYILTRAEFEKLIDNPY